MDPRFGAPMPPREFGEKVVSVLDDPKYAEGFAFGLKGDTGVVRSRRQQRERRKALAKPGSPGGAPRPGRRAAARFALYCARLMGSVIDGEDVVQDTLVRAFVALQDLEELPSLRPWLFRIAHNRALDLLRSREVRMAEPIDAATDVVDLRPARPLGDVDAQGRGQNRGVMRCGAPHPPAQCRHPEAPVAVPGRWLRLSAAG